MIYLVYAADPIYGGWVSYTSHLCGCFHEMKEGAQICKIASRTEKSTRVFNDGYSYWNVSLAQLKELCKTDTVLVTAIGQSQAHNAAELLSAGAHVVIHDPTELTEKVRTALLQSKKPIITVRKANIANLNGIGKEAVFIPHPYVEPKRSCPSVEMNAVSISRLDWDKNMHIIVGANRVLPKEKQVKMYGAINRLYSFHKLDKLFPGWEINYFGKFSRNPRAAFDLASRAKWVVDMSTIKCDGGGTQYTFLEAWAAGTPLVIHRDWLRPNDEMVEGVNCLAAGNAEELAGLLGGTAPDFGRIPELGLHKPSSVIPLFKKVL